jgi:TatD DNase family protein
LPVWRDPVSVRLVDTHCHLDLAQFDPDRPAVLERAAQVGVECMLIPGLNLISSRAVLALVENNPMLFAALGIHPTEALTWTDHTLAEIQILLDSSTASTASGALETSKIIAIGEIGLDYYWDAAPHDLQKQILHQQLSLAAQAGLPVILHMREPRNPPQGACAADLLQILEEWVESLHAAHTPRAARPGVLHSFSGTLETARRALSLGFYIGVTGAITHPKARLRQKITAVLPLEKLVIETDAPFQAPHPYQGQRCEPAYVHLVAEAVARLQSCSPEQVAARTSANAARLFAWEIPS